jgi:hypothetical protein
MAQKCLLGPQPDLFTQRLGSHVLPLGCHGVLIHLTLG